MSTGKSSQFATRQGCALCPICKQPFTSDSDVQIHSILIHKQLVGDSVNSQEARDTLEEYYGFLTPADKKHVMSEMEKRRLSK